ncbi:MAG: threonine synthase [Candidatus Sumerlaeaceae bacterium]
MTCLHELERITDMLIALRCIVCGREYEPVYKLTCDVCGPSEGILDAVYDYEHARRTLTKESLASRPMNHWRYREVLPLRGAQVIPPLQVGWTPVYDVPRLAKHLGVAKLWLKDDGRNPTASFKDRASSMGVAKALEFGFRTVACASTGNAASSLAGFAAATGLKSFIFVPQRAPEPKVAQLLLFGATVLRVQGTYDDAYDLCSAAVERFGWYNRNCAINSYLVEGKKTAGLEIGEQLGATPPDWVVVSVGDGCTIAGVWKGLCEMHTLGILNRLPRLLGVQAEGSPAVARQFHRGENAPFDKHEATTVADSICVAVPRNWRKAVRAVKESHGTYITVSDEEILEALRSTPRLSGVLGEPAAVASVAGVAKARQQQIIGPNESVLAVITGNGLKDIRTAISVAGSTHDIPPNIDAVAEVVRKS